MKIHHLVQQKAPCTPVTWWVSNQPSEESQGRRWGPSAQPGAPHLGCPLPQATVRFRVLKTHNPKHLKGQLNCPCFLKPSISWPGPHRAHWFLPLGLMEEEGATELPVYKIKWTLEFKHLVTYFHIYLSYKWISLKELRITKSATKGFHVLSHTFL